MNQYVALNTNNINGMLGKIPKDSQQALLFELWIPDSGWTGGYGGYGYPEHGTLQGTGNLEYISIGSSFTKYLAWRHNGGMNFLKKDGSVEWTKPGNSGRGEKPIWYFNTDGTYWQDGTLKN